MLGTIRASEREATVVGAGIAGLLAAYALDRAGFRVTLLEAEARAGGMIRTVQAAHGLSESAAHSLQATPAVRALCGELGVELLPVNRDSRARFVWREGRLRRFPLGLGEALGAFARAYFVPAAGAPPKGAPPQTMQEWGERHLGGAAVSSLLAPFIGGIYGARPSELAVAAAFPALGVDPGQSLLSMQLKKLLRGPRSRRSPRAMVAPRDGMGSLVDSLCQALERSLGPRFQLGTRLTRLPEAPNLVLAVPAPEAARLLAPVAPALAESLRAVRYSPLVSVTAFVPRSACPPDLRGVGALAAEGQGRRCLGILFNSSAFEGRTRSEDWRSFTMMLGGSAHPELLTASDEHLRQVARLELAEMLGIGGVREPSEERLELVIHRWERAVPQYGQTVLRTWELARATWCAEPGRVLFGNYAGQVSIRGMIESAQELRERMAGPAPS